MKKIPSLVLVALSLLSHNAVAFDGGRGMHLALMSGEPKVATHVAVAKFKKPPQIAGVILNQHPIAIPDFMTLPK